MDPSKLSEEERGIFSFWNGASRVFADPMRIYRRIFASLGGKPDEIAKAALSSDPITSVEAEEKLVAGIREAFAMVPFDETTGQGATDSQCLDAWDNYLGYLVKKEPPLATSPTCSQPTAAESPSAPTTQPGSASG